MSKVYRVGFSYTVYGTAMHVEADSKEEAERWLFDELEQNGLDEFEYEVNDREYGTQDGREVA